MKVKEYVLLSLLVILVSLRTGAQEFINGDFEDNTATTDQINLTNPVFTAAMANTEAFGTFGNCDIITSGTWGGGGAQNGDWYVALTGGGTDIISMELNTPLVSGQTYSFSFWDRKEPLYTCFPVEIGVSNSSSDFGESVYVADGNAINNIWTERVVTFTAPFDAEYITVQQSAGTSSNWVNIDNFSVNCTIVANLGEDIVACEGDNVELDATIDTEEDITYEWQDGSVDPVLEVNETGLYSVTVISDLCTSSDQISVQIVPYPVLTMEESVTSCIDEPVDIQVMSDIVFVTYSWSNGDDQPTTTVSEPGIYTVEVNNFGLCTSTESIQVDFVDYPEVELGEDQLICEGTFINLFVGNMNNDIVWSTGETTPSISISDEGPYNVEVSNGYCTSYDDFYLNTEICDISIEMPNIFTPNDDANNDYFTPKLKNNVHTLDCSIFNRWGEVLYQTNNPDIMWDGTFNGADSPTGTYYYVLQVANESGDEVNFDGYFLLSRE